MDPSEATVAKRTRRRMQPAELLVRAIRNGKLARAVEVLAEHPPETFEDVMVDPGSPARDIPYEAARQDPALNLVRAVALFHDSNSDHAELAPLLRESLDGLTVQRRHRWAGCAGQWYVFYLAYRSEIDIDSSACMELLERFPDAQREHPLFLAMCAYALAMTGAHDHALRCWQEAREHEACRTSADDYWRVEIEWARAMVHIEVAPFASVIDTLERARAHFRGRSTPFAQRRLHDTSMLLALTLTIVNRPTDALRIVEEDLDVIRLAGEYRPYLQAFRALAAAECEQWRTCRDAFQQIAFARDVYAGLELAIIGPARLCLALRTDGETAVQEHVSSMLRLEAMTRTTAMPRALWRLTSFETLAAVMDVDPWRWLLDEAREIARSASLPTLELRALAIDIEEGVVRDHEDATTALAERAVELISLQAPREILTTQPGALAGLCMAAAANPDMQAPVRALLLIARRPARDQAMERALSTSGDRDSLADWLARCGLIPPREERLIPLEFTLLGAFEIRSKRGTLPPDHWHGRLRARLLLARLLLADGAHESPSDIEHALWPGEKRYASSASKRLAPLVFKAREAIERLTNRPAKDVIRSVRQTYSMRLDAGDSCDVLTFRRAVRQCLSASAPIAVERFGNAALKLYRGEFLPEEGEQAWVQSVRERLHRDVADVVLHMLDVGVEFRATPFVVRRLRDALAVDAINERLCEALIRLCATTGSLGDATRAFHMTRHALREQLGISPSERLISAHDESLSLQQLASAPKTRMVEPS